MLKSFFLFVTILIIISFNSIVCSQTLSLDGLWHFRTDYYNEGEEKGWEKIDFDTQHWDKINVPGNWNTLLPYSDYTGMAWYSTTFDYDFTNLNVDHVLKFEAVYNNADVWLNGKLLGSHDFGFTSFSFNINDAVYTNKTNKLVVRVNNAFKLGATWNWGGIRRSVTIDQLPKSRIEQALITSELDLKTSLAEINARLNLVAVQAGSLRMTIKNREGKIVGKKSVKVSPQNSKPTISIHLKNMHKWHFDSPYLYSADIELENKDGSRHSVTERFGIRKIEIKGYKLLLNGESIRLNGANYVPDDRFTGNTLPEEKFKRDIDQMKSCGVNMARLSHMALPKDVLDYLDEKGMLIFEEIPLWNKNKYVNSDDSVPIRWLTELITQRYNHPSIIGWSAGNEIGRLTDNPDIAGYLESAFRHIKELDPNRLAVYVTNTAAKQNNEPVLLSDLIMFNQYGAHGERVDTVNRNYPGKPIFYAEYGTKVNEEDLNNSNADYAAMLESIRGREFLIGASVWTFNDYRSNYKDNNTFATENRPWGVVDAYGRQKRGYHRLQNENAPVKGIFANIGTIDSIISGTIDVHPRQILDLPAYVMNGYKIEVSGFDKNSNAIIVQTIDLPAIYPGSGKRKYNFSVNKGEICKLEISLLSPTAYNVYSVAHHLYKPNNPHIEYIECSDKKVRVYFGQDHSADEWYVKYGISGLDKTTEPTINNYIELSDLEFEQNYKIQLVAVNNLGETPSNRIFETSTIAAELPPIVCHLKQKGENIQIAYTCSNDEYMYEFEYGLSPDKLDKYIQTTTVGACNLPVIDKDADHYIRIRMRLRYGYESQWSRIYKVDKEINNEKN